MNTTLIFLDIWITAKFTVICQGKYAALGLFPIPD